MNKQEFIDIVGVKRDMTEPEVKILETLVHRYPYFQNGHILLAKASKRLNLQSYKEKMNTAAVYATNRAVFKKVLMSGTISKSKPGSITKPQKTPPPSSSRVPRLPQGDLDKFIGEVYQNLEDWKSSRELYLEYEKEHPEEIVILPVEKPQDDFEMLKRQVADEVEAEETIQESEITPESTSSTDIEQSSDTTEHTKIEKPSDQKENTDPTSKKPPSSPKEKNVSVPKIESLESVEKELDQFVDKINSGTQSTSEEVDQVLSKEEKESSIGIPEAQSTSEDQGHPISPSTPNPETELESASSDESDLPIIDESVIELKDPETVYDFNAPIPVPQEAPKDLQKKNTPSESSKKEEEEMISTEELTEIVDRVSQEVEEEESSEDNYDKIESKEVENLQIIKEASPAKVEEIENVSKVDQAESSDTSSETMEGVSTKDLEEVDEIENSSSDDQAEPTSSVEIMEDASTDIQAVEKTENTSKDSDQDEITNEVSLEDLKSVEEIKHTPKADQTEPSNSSSETMEEVSSKDLEEVDEIEGEPEEEEVENSDSFETIQEVSPESIGEVKEVHAKDSTELDEQTDTKSSLPSTKATSKKTTVSKSKQVKSTTKLVSGASKGDKKFRLSVLKRPHNFTKPKPTKKKVAETDPVSNKVSLKKATSKSKTVETEKKTAEKKQPAKKTVRKTKKTPPEKAPLESKKTTARAEKKNTKDKKKSEPTVKKKAEIENKHPKKEVQNEIIDSFIETNPSIEVSRTKKDIVSEIEDLAENSTVFPDNLITENLATILTDQGKTQRAIEIYEKLILKNPQKKSYFASQIEILKNL